MKDNSLTNLDDKNVESQENTEQTPNIEPLFSKRSILAAVLGGAILLVWAFVSTLLLSFSPFSMTHAPEKVRTEFIARICMTFFIYGLLAGFVFYHLWRSVQLPPFPKSNRVGFVFYHLWRKKMFQWMLKLGGAAAVIGAMLGAILPLYPPYSNLTGLNGRIMIVISYAATFAVITASLVALFTSSKRRVILKAIFLPMALSLILRVLLLTFAPVDVTFMNNPFGNVSTSSYGSNLPIGGKIEKVPPWIILNYIDEPAVQNTVVVFLVGLVVAGIRRFKPQKPIESQ